MSRMQIIASLSGMLALVVIDAAAAADDSASTQTRIACDVSLNVADPDPRGLNVRAAPRADSRVIAVLKPDAEWTTVHVTAQQGGWMRIDRATGIDDDAPDGERVVFAGDGWVSLKLLRISDLYVGGGNRLYQRPDRGARVVFRLEGESSTPSQVLGCQGTFIRVRHGRHVGWTDTWCNNERTTCS